MRELGAAVNEMALKKMKSQNLDNSGVCLCVCVSVCVSVCVCEREREREAGLVWQWAKQLQSPYGVKRV